MGAAQLDQYFDCVLAQYAALLQETARLEGAGVAVFEFFAQPKANGANCRFRYCEQGGQHWQFLVAHAPEVTTKYSADKHLLVAVTVPAGEHNSEKAAQLRLFSKETCAPIR